MSSSTSVNSPPSAVTAAVGKIWTAAVPMESFEDSSSVRTAAAGPGATKTNIKTAGSERRIISRSAPHTVGSPPPAAPVSPFESAPVSSGSGKHFAAPRQPTFNVPLVLSSEPAAKRAASLDPPPFLTLKPCSQRTSTFLSASRRYFCGVHLTLRVSE